MDEDRREEVKLEASITFLPLRADGFFSAVRTGTVAPTKRPREAIPTPHCRLMP